MAIQNPFQPTPGDGRPDQELARRTAGHAEHLGDADQGRRPRGGEVGGGDIGRADQGEDPAHALQEAPDRRQVGVAGGEQQRAHRDDRAAQRHHGARAQLVHGHAGHQAERRVAVVEKAHQGGEPRRRQAQGVGQAAASSPPAPNA
jgi:hypothetical protein